MLSKKEDDVILGDDTAMQFFKEESRYPSCRFCTHVMHEVGAGLFWYSCAFCQAQTPRCKSRREAFSKVEESQ